MHRCFWYARPTSKKTAVIFQFRTVKAHLFSTKAKLERWRSIILGKLEFLRRLAFPTFLDYYCFLLCKADKAHSCLQFDMATPTLCITATLPCYHSCWPAQLEFHLRIRHERLPCDFNKTMYRFNSLFPKEIQSPGATTSLWKGKVRQGENTYHK